MKPFTVVVIVGSIVFATCALAQRNVPGPDSGFKMNLDGSKKFYRNVQAYERGQRLPGSSDLQKKEEVTRPALALTRSGSSQAVAAISHPGRAANQVRSYCQPQHRHGARTEISSRAHNASPAVQSGE